MTVISSRLCLDIPFLIMVIICFTALEFQRKVMEMLVEMRKDIRSLKKRDAEKYEATQIQQASAVEALNLLDRSLDSLEEKQKLVRSTVVIAT